MSFLVLVRHGESRWNLENRFTGWVDIPLSKNGVREAERVARHCLNFKYSVAYTSALERAQATLSIILSRQNKTGIFLHHGNKRYSKMHTTGKEKDDLPVITSEKLNERYYGDLQGMNKHFAEEKYGKDKVFLWRRGYASRPPRGESLKEVHARVHDLLHGEILPSVKRGESILCVAHGNTLRAIIKHLENISSDDVAFIDLPNATPLVYRCSARGQYIRTEGVYKFSRPLR